MSQSNTYETIREALGRLRCVIPDLVLLDGPNSEDTCSVWTPTHGMCVLRAPEMSESGYLDFSAIVPRGAPPSLATAVCHSPLFGNAERVAADAVKRALRQAGRQMIVNVNREDPAYSDLALRTGAAFLAPKIGRAGASTTQVLEAITSIVLAAAAPKLERIRTYLDPDFCRAADLLAKCPDVDVMPGTVGFYMGLDAPSGERASLADKRRRAVAQFPSLSGHFARVPRIADALDGGEKLFRAVEEASGGHLTRPIITRLGQTSDPRARLAVAGGMLQGLPPDQYPNTHTQWTSALDLWDASGALANEMGVPITTVWRPARIIHAKGDWEGLVKNVLAKGTDVRPPHDLGLTKEDAADILGAISPEPFTPEEDAYEKLARYLQVAERRLAAMGEREDRNPLNDFNKEVFSSWMLRICFHEVTPQTLYASMRGAQEAAGMFGQRVLMPNVLNAERLTGLPMVPEVLQGAERSAFGLLTGDMTFPQIATFSRNFTSRAHVLSAPLISSRERALGETPAEPKQPDRQRIEDGVWRRVFNITDDVADWPTITPIIEFKPGIVFVPIENMTQAREEGTLTPGKPDRNGVPEMNHCMGLIHAPKAIAQAGGYQLFSIREVKNGTYRRLASGTFRMTHDQKTGAIAIVQPVEGATFVGPSNSKPSALAREIFNMFCEFVVQRPEAVNPAIIEVLRAQKSPEAAKPAQHIRRDLTLPRILGYNPFEVYKVETAWDNWKGAGLVSQNYLKMSLAERARLPQLDPLHESIRKLLSAMGVQQTVRPLDREAAAAPKPIPATPTRRGMSGAFF